MAQTTYTYDVGSLQGPGFTPPQQDSPPLLGPTYRGNETQESRWLAPSGSVSNTKSYYTTGMVYLETDANSHTSTYVYSSAYAGALKTESTDPMSHNTFYSYDDNTGVLLSETDPNNQITSYQYDSMERITSATFPSGGGSATISRQESTIPFSATLSRTMNSSQSVVRTNLFDGMGRVAQSKLTSDTQGTIYTDTTYDADGHTGTVSNPYRSISDSTYGLTGYAYDGLGRTLTVTKPDSSVVTTMYCDNVTIVTDESGKWRRSTVDGLGRLTEVDEPNSTSASAGTCSALGSQVWTTVYTVDALGNMTNVSQNGSRQRTFVYDSLSRLTSATNPETGTVTYGYYSDGRLNRKTDARNITVTYTTDADHRLTQKSYSDSTPTLTYSYDQSSCLGQPSCYNVGRRTGMTDAGGGESWSYDAMGRALTAQRTTNNVTKSFNYTYNYDGSIATILYPSGGTLTYAIDNAGRSSSVIDSVNNVNYVIGSCGTSGSGVCYAPQGALSGAVLGNSTNFAGITLTDTYTDRLQPNEIKATISTGTLMDLSYGFNAGDWQQRQRVGGDITV